MAALIFGGYTIIGAAAQGSKPAIHGLLNRGGPAGIPAGYRASLAGYVVTGNAAASVGWNQLQASAGAPITANNPIDAAIADVDAWNAANPSNQEVLKIRVAAGAQTPTWALNLGGTCVQLVNPQNTSQQACIPRFWTPAFQSAWYAFVAELAAQYDTAPEIAEVTMTPNMTFYVEPMIRDTSNSSDVSALLAAGYSTSVDEQNQLCDIGPVSGSCTGGAIASYWPHTTVDYTFNPYQVISSSGTVGVDMSYTQTAITAAHNAGLSLENNSLSQNYLTGTGSYQTMYAAITASGPPITYQTAGIGTVGALATVIQTAGQWGASSVELPSGYACPNSYDNCLTAAQVASLGAALPLPPSPGGGPSPTPSTTPTPTATPTPTPTPTPSPTPTPTPTPSPTPTPPGPPRIVQIVSAVHSAPTVGVTFAPRQAGDLLLVLVTYGGGSNATSGSFSVADTVGTNFAPVATQSTVTANTTTETGNVYVGLTSATSSDTITATEPGGIGSGVLEVVEITGQSAMAPIDALGTSAGGTSVSVTTQSALTSLDDLVFAVSEYYGNGSVKHASFSPAGTGEVNEPVVASGGQNPMSVAFSVQQTGALSVQLFTAQLPTKAAANSEFLIAISPTS